jgi:aspartate/glutamate racemase
MDKRLKGRQYGYLSAYNDNRFVHSTNRQQVAGYSVGIVYIENVNYPMMPGNVVNANTYDFPVRMMAVPNLTNDRLFNNDPTIADDIIATAKHMVENEGVRAICSACGFFGNFHKKVTQAIDAPVALSSLVQLPWIKTLIKPNQKVGILTANASAMTPELFRNCGIEDHSNIVIKDMMHSENFAAVVDMRGHFDNGKARDEVVNAALELFEGDSDIGAILLECSDMPPYAAEIQAATQLPVFDFITLIRWLHNATTQMPYSGWI